MGLSIAASIALPGIGGMLVSCVIDGTFVDMLKAVSTGDWAMLALSCAAFIPGGKALKGLKAVGKTGITVNRAVGKSFERAVISKLGLQKAGTRLEKVGNMKTYRIADAFDKEGNLVEIKHVKQMRITDQTRDQLEWARENGKKVFFAYDASYTTNAKDFANSLSKKYDGLFEMLPVIP